VKTNVLSIAIPKPKDKMSAKKYRRRQQTRHATSDAYFKQTTAKRKVKM
jgi:hypothetical protein